MPSIPLEDDHYCYACGAENPQGLRIDWKVEGAVTTATFTPQRIHQGWKGIVHGGILATLLDEAMTRLAWVARGGALTAEMKVRYLQPVKVGDPIQIRGEITGENRKIVFLKAALFINGPSGIIEVARSEGKAIKL